MLFHKMGHLADEAPLPLWDNVRDQGGIGPRIPLAYKDELRLVGEAALTGIGMARPHVEATIVEPEALQEGVKRFDPHLVICSPPIPADALSER